MIDDNLSELIDVNWYVGDCPFRKLPNQTRDLTELRFKASISRVIACDFNSLFYYDTVKGTEEALQRYESLSEWMQFYLVVNPLFPQWEIAVERASADSRIAALRIAPCLHHYSIDAPEVKMLIRLASKWGVPVNLMARLFDDRIAPQFIKQTVPCREEITKFLHDSASEARISLSMFYLDELESFNLNFSDNPNLYADIGCSKPHVDSLDKLFSWLPSERVLFGTGAPLYYWGGSLLGLEKASWTTIQRGDVLKNNARTFFNWD